MNRVLLDTIDHRDLVVAPRSGAAWGDAVNLLPVFPAEFEDAQREFPIVFRRIDGGVHAFVLLGLERGENLFLDDDRWTTRYVPAVQRHGPFSIAAAADGAEAPAIHVDLDDPRVGAADGLPLFREHGGPAPYLDHVTTALRVIHDGALTATAIHADLEAAGLLRAGTIRLDLGEVGEYELVDLLTIDQAALAGLSGAPLERLHGNGLLRAATMAAASLGNIERLIDLKIRAAT